MADFTTRALRRPSAPVHGTLEYPKASHSLGYLIPHLPAGLLPPEITDAAADKAARADAWPRTVTFIRRLGNTQVTARVRTNG